MARHATGDVREKLAERLEKTEQEVEIAAAAALRRRRGGRVPIRIFLGTALALWLASSVQLVQAGQRGVVQSFGRYVATVDAGLNWFLPWPLQEVRLVDVRSVRWVELGTDAGMSASDARGEGRLPGQGLALARDGKVVRVSLKVQYRVEDPVAYSFNVKDPDQVLLTTAETALSAVVGQRHSDIAASQPSSLQEEIHALTQTLLDSYRSGIRVVQVQLPVAEVLE